MLCRIFIFILFSIAASHYQSKAQAQHTNPLTGVWYSKELNLGTCLVFGNDSTGYFTTSTGIITGRFSYAIQKEQFIYAFHYFVDIPNQKRFEVKANVHFLNDSVFSIKFGNAKHYPDTLMSGKGVYVFHKYKDVAPETFKRLPSMQDLVGVWQLTFKKELKAEQFIFKADGTGIHSYENNPLMYFHYTVDFTHRPHTIDLRYDVGKTVPAYIGFYNDTTIRLEGFPNGKRPDHWTMFGHNIRLVKQH